MATPAAANTMYVLQRYYWIKLVQLFKVFSWLGLA